MGKTSCKIICGAPTTLAVKGLMMMMMIKGGGMMKIRIGPNKWETMKEDKNRVKKVGNDEG